MRSDPVSPAQVLRALELVGPQARPYNFDDCFDCWGLVRAVFDLLDDGYEVNDELGSPGDEREGRWRRVSGPGALVPGDLIATHPHGDERFHCAFYCGRVGGDDLVYDSSPRGAIPLYDESLQRTAARPIFTRFMRATETTDRLRDDGGAYLRLWDERNRYVNVAFHERLLAGGGAEQRDLVALRRAAGLDELPFYCRHSLPHDRLGRELYDNLATRSLDYYVPDGPPLPDGEYLAASSQGMTRDATGSRPAAPVFTSRPAWISRRAPLVAEWRYPSRQGQPVTGCRVEVWEETWDLWRHRLLREDHDEPLTRRAVPPERLRPGTRFAVVVHARGPGGYSAGAVAPFLFRPAPDDPLLAHNPVRPSALSPDEGAAVHPGRDVALQWHMPQPRSNQAYARVDVYEEGPPGSEAPLVFSAELSGAASAACACVIPAGAWLRPGFTYRWYVTSTNARGQTVCAPSEGLFVIGEEGEGHGSRQLEEP